MHFIEVYTLDKKGNCGGVEEGGTEGSKRWSVHPNKKNLGEMHMIQCTFASILLSY